MFFICSTSYLKAQTSNCDFKIVQLRLDNGDTSLYFAKLTKKTLIVNSDIKHYEVRTDTGCCTYVGKVYSRSHHFALTKQAVARLFLLKIPLNGGIPVAVYVDNNEIYRARLWNPLSSFGNQSITMTLTRDTIIVTNELPVKADFHNQELTQKIPVIKCLLNR